MTSVVSEPDIGRSYHLQASPLMSTPIEREPAERRHFSAELPMLPFENRRSSALVARSATLPRLPSTGYVPSTPLVVCAAPVSSSSDIMDLVLASSTPVERPPAEEPARGIVAAKVGLY